MISQEWSLISSWRQQWPCWSLVVPRYNYEDKAQGQGIQTKFFGIHSRHKFPLLFHFWCSLSLTTTRLPHLFYLCLLCLFRKPHYAVTLCRYGNTVCSVLRFFNLGEENFLVSKYCMNAIFVFCDLGQWSSPAKENHVLHVLQKVLPTKGFT